MVNPVFSPWYILLAIVVVTVLGRIYLMDSCGCRRRREARSNRRRHAADYENGCRPNIPTLATPPPAYSSPARNRDVPAPPYNPGPPPMYQARSQV